MRKGREMLNFPNVTEKNRRAFFLVEKDAKT